MDVPDKAVVEYLEGTAPEGSPQAEFAALEALRALLAEDALWAEPSPDLETTVISAVEPRSQT